jgi:hypothetical protein
MLQLLLVDVAKCSQGASRSQVFSKYSKPETDETLVVFFLSGTISEATFLGGATAANGGS